MDIVKTASTGLPAEVLFNLPEIRIVGNASVYVENYSALVEYRRENIKLKYKGGIIEISGSDFEIREIGEGNIAVNGKIEAVKLI